MKLLGQREDLFGQVEQLLVLLVLLLHRRPLLVGEYLPPGVGTVLADQDEGRRDATTTFAGSMTFVYIHMLWFGCWIVFGVEHYPFGLLTMIVSLDSISTSRFWPRDTVSSNRAFRVIDGATPSGDRRSGR